MVSRMSEPTPKQAIDGIQEAIDELWKMERELESSGLSSEETTSAVLQMDKLLKDQQQRWRVKNV